MTLKKKKKKNIFEKSQEGKQTKPKDGSEKDMSLMGMGGGGVTKHEHRKRRREEGNREGMR